VSKSGLTIRTALILIFAFAANSLAEYSGGTGEPNSPFEIARVADWQELMDTPADWDKYFVLTADLDVNGVDLSPVGNDANNFTGILDGDNHIIRNARMSFPDTYHIGLFGYAGGGCRIHNLGIEDANISGDYYVGCLAGRTYGSIMNCYASGSVSGTDYVGGLVGRSRNGIRNCYARATVNGDDFVGGLVGRIYGHFSNCYAAGSVSGDDSVGGLVGYDEAGSVSRGYFLHPDDGGGWDNGYGVPLTNSQMADQASFIGWDFVRESVNGTSEIWQMPVGGGYPVLSSFAGYAPAAMAGSGTAEDPYLISDANDLGAIYHYDSGTCWRLTADIDLAGIIWSGSPIPIFSGVFDGDGRVIRNLDVNVPDSEYIGLFGFVCSDARIVNIGIEDASIAGRAHVGSLVGYCDNGTISNCHAAGLVSGGSYVGGLAGFTESGTTSDCYSTCSVNGGANVGCLVGYNYHEASITDCNATGSASGTNHIGSLVGLNYGVISNCCGSGSVSGESTVGGLVGNNNHGTIINCYSTSVVFGDIWVGGLAGGHSGWIINCYGTGSVTCTGRYSGGLIGNNMGVIINCYATGSVSGEEYAGGLVGQNYDNDGILANCYATGSVNGIDYVGGAVGYDESGGISGVYFLAPNDGGGPDNGYGTPLSNSQMSDQASFIGWDFVGESANGISEAWQMDTGSGGPVLSSFNGYVAPELIGSGTADSPYLISGPNEFGAIYHQHPADCYRLTGDVDLAGITWSVPPIPAFFGTFAGNDHVISNLDINMPDVDYVGLFGYAHADCRILNTGIEDASIVGRKNVGSLVGYASGDTSNCYASGSVVGNSAVGGLTGRHYEGRIVNCYATSTVGGEKWIGGLVGYDGSDMTNCYAMGEVSGSEMVGGLVGYNVRRTIRNCYATGSVGKYKDIGGLVGYNNSIIIDCYAVGSVSGNGRLGGLVGKNRGLVTGSYAAGAVAGSRANTGDAVGGLVGQCENGTISNSHATGPVSGKRRVGGLVGFFEHEYLTDCFATGPVYGRDEYVGGLVGYNVSGRITNCYGAGPVSSDGDYVGGLVGYFDEDRLVNCYATGSVDGGNYVGGLIGYGDSVYRIQCCYSAGSVSGDSHVGGLVGMKDAYGDIIGGYFRSLVDGGGPDNGYGEALSDIQMRQQGSFVGWDFVGEEANGTDDSWRMCVDGVVYPQLNWEFSENGDFACPDGIGYEDLDVLAGRWLGTDCISQNNCAGTDMTGDGNVDFADYARFAELGMEGL